MISKLTFALVLAVSCLFGESAAAAECFRIFDVTGYRNKPDLTSYGIRAASVIYAYQHYWPNGRPMESLPEQALVESTVRRRVEVDKSPPLVINDLEHWPNVGSDAVVAETQRKYIALAQWTKASAGGAAVGYYGVPPLRDYWRAIRNPEHAEFRAWQAENDRFKDLAEVLDVLSPSLYTFYDDVEGWKRYAAANVAEARRLHGGKPVYPFIWPQYHDSNRTLGGQYLPATVWLQQLKTLEGMVDGVIIWAPPGWWNDDAPWWLATKAFIAGSSRTGPEVCN